MLRNAVGGGGVKFIGKILRRRSVGCHIDKSFMDPGLEIRGSNGSKCYHVFSFATGMLMW